MLFKEFILSALATEVKTKTKIKKPSKYAVFILNDDYTPWQFVVSTLMKIFNKTEEEANIITTSVHHGGQGLCGAYTKEISESKVQTATDFAKVNKQPLRTVMQKI
jgi:ATP-dependent Clp protease adaptor protein ClpS